MLNRSTGRILTFGQLARGVDCENLAEKNKKMTSWYAETRLRLSLDNAKDSGKEH